MDKLRVIHLEDNPDDVFFVKGILAENNFDTEVIHVNDRDEFLAAVEQKKPDVILSDHALPGFGYESALEIAKAQYPEVPFIIVSGTGDGEQISASLGAGASDYVLKNELWKLIPLFKEIQEGGRLTVDTSWSVKRVREMKYLVMVMQELLLARRKEGVMKLVCQMTRNLIGAEGVAFILKDGDQSFYAEENSVSPLWKGLRFQSSDCISGQVMEKGKLVVIEEITSDPRIASHIFDNTFVRSLMMAPVRMDVPIGALGVYWGKGHNVTALEKELLYVLANMASVAMANVQLFIEQDNLTKQQNRELEGTSQELELFSFSITGDLQSFLHKIRLYTRLLGESQKESMDMGALRYLSYINSEIRRMEARIQNILLLGDPWRELKVGTVNLSDMARDLMADIMSYSPERMVDVHIKDNVEVEGDANLLKTVLENLLSNAWKYSFVRDRVIIEFGSRVNSARHTEYFVRDNGAGMDRPFAEILFTPLSERSRRQYDRKGLGLITVKRIIELHGGKISVDTSRNAGATFYFTLPQQY